MSKTVYLVEQGNDAAFSVVQKIMNAAHGDVIGLSAEEMKAAKGIQVMNIGSDGGRSELRDAVKARGIG